MREVTKEMLEWCCPSDVIAFLMDAEIRVKQRGPLSDCYDSSVEAEMEIRDRCNAFLGRGSSCEEAVFPILVDEDRFMKSILHNVLRIAEYSGEVLGTCYERDTLFIYNLLGVCIHSIKMPFNPLPVGSKTWSLPWERVEQ